jgi:hypothetical protein
MAGQRRQACGCVAGAFDSARSDIESVAVRWQRHFGCGDPKAAALRPDERQPLQLAVRR